MSVPTKWWQNQSILIGFAIASTIPLLYPPIPPLVDLPSHMGRYAVALAQGEQTPLDQFYTYEWSLIGNLGVDLLAIAVARVVGLEMAVKLIIILIPLLTCLGIIAVAKQAHGTITPFAFFALPLSYATPFILGFANFTLSIALALLVFALWINMGARGLGKLRAAFFMVIAPMIFIVHVSGWAALCLMCAAYELSIRYKEQRRIYSAAISALPHGIALSIPIFLIYFWRAGVESSGGLQASGWFDFRDKLLIFGRILRERWLWFDVLNAAVILGVCGAGLGLAVAKRDQFKISMPLFCAGSSIIIAVLILPHRLFESAYADMRLAPLALIFLLVSVDVRPQAPPFLPRMIAAAGAGFFAVKIAVTTASFFMLSQNYSAALGALSEVPEGAKLLSFVGRSCEAGGGSNRMEHLPALAIIRRHAFSNEQWANDGAQLLRSIYPQGNEIERHFSRNPSQLVTPPDCPNPYEKPLNWALKNFPRDKFDYIWLIAPPPYDARLLDDTQEVWRNGQHSLHRIERKIEPSN